MRKGFSMTKDEFEALLAIEGKKLHTIGKLPDAGYAAMTVTKDMALHDYAYGANEAEAIQNLITRLYADN